MHWTNSARILTVLAALAAANAVLAQSPPKVTVVLDPAHGGDDSGAKLATGQSEKALVLTLSTRLRALLVARGFAVITTRDQDATVDPARRAELANLQTPRACISLHAAETGSGVHLFVSSLTPATAGSKLTAWRTAQGAWVTQSLALAGTLDSALRHAFIAVTVDRTPLPAVDSMSCPAVVVEISPLRNNERKVTSELNNEGYLNHVLEALAAALLEWRSEARQP